MDFIYVAFSDLNNNHFQPINYVLVDIIMNNKGFLEIEPVLFWIFIECLHIRLEDGISILVTGVPFHELIIYGDKP